MQLRFAKAHHEIPPEEKVGVTLAAEASDFTFGTQLEFAKAHHKITPRGKSGHGLGLGELPNILWFPYNISATDGASDFKFGMQLEFAKAHDKITRSI